MELTKFISECIKDYAEFVGFVLYLFFYVLVAIFIAPFYFIYIVLLTTFEYISGSRSINWEVHKGKRNS